jgi:hypothetical protein
VGEGLALGVREGIGVVEGSGGATAELQADSKVTAKVKKIMNRKDRC